MKKSDREIMEILEAFDATQSAHSAAGLAEVDPKTVRRYVAARDEGRPVTGPGRRARMLDEHMGKIEEWVERGNGKVHADVIHGRLVAMGLAGTERTTRRAVAQVKAAGRAGHRRAYRPWITEPGCGSSSTGARARGCRARTGGRGGRGCFARGWLGEAPQV
ncbi:MAG: hypothetical protein L0G89_09825 [Janibacter sp.]|nr:hypothetical protein [Janibacter sp.]